MDIVQRIEDYLRFQKKSKLAREAADEILRLRKQNAVLETELALVRSMLPNVKAYQTGTGDFTPLKEGE